MKVVLVHYQPPEGYPPIQNLWNFVQNNKTYCTSWLLTTGKKKIATGNIQATTVNADSNRRNLITIYNKQNRALRVIKFFLFHFKCIFYLIKHKPDKIIYFESLSAIGPLLYKKYINNKVHVIVHYHEYATKNENKLASFTSNISWRYEMKNYHLISFFSHTNSFRLSKFIDDYKLDISKSLILPNYPPAEWKLSTEKKIKTGVPVKIVYVGYGLSNITMYIEEFFSWVYKQHGKFTLDCYITFIDESTTSLLDRYRCKYIKLHQPVPYYQLPETIKNYDIGVIVYRNTTENYTYNAPNKLFEYHVLGLDVWFPDVLIGSLEYITTKTYPKILPLNFMDLDHFDVDAALNRDNLFEKITDFGCEEIYTEYFKSLGIINSLTTIPIPKFISC